MPPFAAPNKSCVGQLIEGKELKYEKRHSTRPSRLTGLRQCDTRTSFSSDSANASNTPDISTDTAAGGPSAAKQLLADDNLLEELQALFSRLGAAKILLTVYLVEFGGLPQPLAKPLLQEATGSCAILRHPTPGHHLVIYLGPEPSAEAGGFLGRLRRGLTSLTPSDQSTCAQSENTWAEDAWAVVRMLRRGNHDITAPTHLLLDLNAAAPRVLGMVDW